MHAHVHTGRSIPNICVNLLKNDVLREVSLLEFDVKYLVIYFVVVVVSLLVLPIRRWRGLKSPAVQKKITGGGVE